VAGLDTGAAPFPGMVWIPGGTFRMGSDKHYPEERPVHRVTVDGLWMDCTPVTNERFARFVEATGHVTFAEIVRRAEDYPGALPDQLFAGSLVFAKPAGPVDRRDFTNWWHWVRGRDRQRVGMDDRLVSAEARGRGSEGLLRSRQSKGRTHRGQLRPLSA
jgi:formylglycine-generating enzyme